MHKKRNRARPGSGLVWLDGRQVRDGTEVVRSGQVLEYRRYGVGREACVPSFLNNKCRPPWRERPVPRLDACSAVLYEDGHVVVLNKPSGAESSSHGTSFWGLRMARIQVCPYCRALILWTTQCSIWQGSFCHVTNSRPYIDWGGALLGNQTDHVDGHHVTIFNDTVI